jgi:hypothetical protein
MLLLMHVGADRTLCSPSAAKRPRVKTPPTTPAKSVLSLPERGNQAGEKFDRLLLIETPEASALHRRDMDKDVVTATLS